MESEYSRTMRYLPELFYLQDQKDFPLQKAVEVTAVTVSHWCRFYEARLIVPVSKESIPLQKSGALPDGMPEREAFIHALVDWLFAHSNPPELFTLRLADDPLSSKDGVAKFDHPDDTCCWTLDLSAEQFTELQLAWQAQALPTDLFYPEGQQICVPYRGKSWKARLFRWLGVQTCYTPKQWVREQQAANS